MIVFMLPFCKRLVFTGQFYDSRPNYDENERDLCYQCFLKAVKI